MIKIPLPLALAVVALAAFFAIGQRTEARAASGTAAMMAIMQNVPMNASSAVWSAYAAQAAAVGPGFMDSGKVTCLNNASTEIISPASQAGKGRQLSYTCQTPISTDANGTVLIGVGKSSMGNPAFATRTTPVYSGNTIREWGGNTSDEYCKGDGADVAIFCRFLIAGDAAP